MSERPKCYACKHRRNLLHVHDAHSKCVHPKRETLKVEGNEHGIRHGWFAWPLNFDPVWLEECDGFEE